MPHASNEQFRAAFSSLSKKYMSVYIYLYVPGDVDEFTIPECLMDSSWLLLCHISPYSLIKFYVATAN